MQRHIPLVFTVLLLFVSLKVSVAQDCNFRYSLPDSICGGASFNPFAEAAPSSSVLWDFCGGDAALSPAFSTGTTLNGTSTINSLRIIEDGGNYNHQIL